MTLPKLNLDSDEGTFQVQFGDEFLEVDVEGGPAWRRRDFFGTPHRANVRWVLDAFQFRYLTAFRRTTLGEGVLPFLIDMPLLDGDQEAEYQVQFIRGTYRISRSGDAHIVSAQLEVRRTLASEVDDEFDLTFIYFYGIYGDSLRFVLLDLERIANVTIPDNFPGV